MRTLMALMCISVPWTSVAAKVPKDGEPAPASAVGVEAPVTVRTGCGFEVGDVRTYELKWSTKSVFHSDFPIPPVGVPPTNSGWTVRARLQVTESTADSITVITQFSAFDEGRVPSDAQMMDRAVLSNKHPVTFSYEHATSTFRLVDSGAYLAETRAGYVASMLQMIGHEIPPEDIVPEGWDDIVPALLTARLVSVFAGSCQDVSLGETTSLGEFGAGSAVDSQPSPAQPAKTTTTTRFEQLPDESLMFTTVVNTTVEIDKTSAEADATSLTSDTTFTSTITPSGWSSGWTQSSTTKHPVVSVDWESTGTLISEP